MTAAKRNPAKARTSAQVASHTCGGQAQTLPRGQPDRMRDFWKLLGTAPHAGRRKWPRCPGSYQRGSGERGDVFLGANSWILLAVQGSAQMPPPRHALSAHPASLPLPPFPVSGYPVTPLLWSSWNGLPLKIMGFASRLSH